MELHSIKLSNARWKTNTFDSREINCENNMVKRMSIVPCIFLLFSTIELRK